MANPASYLASGSSFWRQAGINYLQYLGICTGALRNVLKEPKRAQAIAKGSFQYNKAIKGTDKGIIGDKVVVTNKKK